MIDRFLSAFLMLQYFRIPGADKVHIRMDMVVVFCSNGYNDSAIYKNMFTALDESLLLGPGYTRAQIVYSRDRLIGSSSFPEIIRMLNNTALNSSQARNFTVICDGLAEADSIFEKYLTTNAVKVTVLVVTEIPAIVLDETEVQQDTKCGFQHAKRLRQRGLFFVLQTPTVADNRSAADYLARLAERRKPIRVEMSDEIGAAFRNVVVPEVVKFVCSNRSGFCQFGNAQRNKCSAIWRYHLNHTNCTETPADRPASTDCNLNDCYRECDRWWKWSEDIFCDCNSGIQRQNSNPLPQYLLHCPETDRCPSGCDATPEPMPAPSRPNSSSGYWTLDETENAKRSTTEPELNMDFSRWVQIVLIVIWGLTGSIVVGVCYAIRRRRKRGRRRTNWSMKPDRSKTSGSHSEPIDPSSMSAAEKHQLTGRSLNGRSFSKRPLTDEHSPSTRPTESVKSSPSSGAIVVDSPRRRDRIDQLDQYRRPAPKLDQFGSPPRRGIDRLIERDGGGVRNPNTRPERRAELPVAHRARSPTKHQRNRGDRQHDGPDWRH